MSSVVIKINKVIFLFFLCRHDDLKDMLDSNKDNLKLEAMKRIIGVRIINKKIYIHPDLLF